MRAGRSLRSPANPENPLNHPRIGAITALLAVALGAFGTHLLRGGLDPAFSRTFETAVRYQFFHALALILVGLMQDRASARDRQTLGVAGFLFLAGTILFSGSLYFMSVTGASWVGAITPLGGAALLAGWVAFALGCGGRRPA